MPVAIILTCCHAVEIILITSTSSICERLANFKIRVVVVTLNRSKATAKVYALSAYVLFTFKTYVTSLTVTWWRIIFNIARSSI